ncbi:glycine zipper 2TM domain-containing protein [Sphingomonas sp.]|jgi:outer membrane lipoprotein SlyB|uniref:glycine zipper 2TM domain-containing protein n=1 Tax=Sphingomonas sp. TaxID=28214 RepID=UPI002D7FCFF4|nr:glycine zipper 2TM domain-containing protein [Sphingomonas sp.]HEU0043084.1 glycine zipper 2TM domain-containing protein [Sphingomonas sp.]
MIKKLSLVGATVAMTASALLPATAADAQRNRRYYDDRGAYAREYRGDDNYNRYRARQKCKDGDGGTIIGAIAGGLLGNTIAGRGDRTVGAILGAAGGALAGRAIDRSDRPNYCRR